MRLSEMATIVAAHSEVPEGGWVILIPLVAVGLIVLLASGFRRRRP